MTTPRAKKKDFKSTAQTMETLRQAGLRHPNVEEGLACKGTVIESITLKVNGRAFLFLRPEKAMLKLESSMAEASKLASEHPACLKVGSGGWATVTLAAAESVPVEVFERWIAESYGLFATKKASTKPKKK